MQVQQQWGWCTEEGKAILIEILFCTAELAHAEQNKSD